MDLSVLGTKTTKLRQSLCDSLITRMLSIAMSSSLATFFLLWVTDMGGCIQPHLEEFQCGAV